MIRSKNYIATPPGATIKEQLGERGMSQREFSNRMGMSEKHISKLINGEVQLTPETAVKLEFVLGVSAKFWNNLEAIYREKIIKVEAENSMDSDKLLAQLMPYNEMAKLGWIPEATNITEKVINLRKYFEVVELSLLESNLITRIACRRLAVTQKSDLALMAWAQKAKLESRRINTEPINVKGLVSSLPEIRKMAKQTPETFSPMLKKILAKYGIALVFLPHLQGSFLQGATFINGNKCVVGLTTRGKDADRFWFSLFHELAHIVLGHIGQPDGTTEEDEKSANRWARDWLIPEKEFKVFLEQNSISPQSVCQFAEKLEIAPGIVVGRLQNEGIINYNVMNALKEQYIIQ